MNSEDIDRMRRDGVKGRNNRVGEMGRKNGTKNKRVRVWGEKSLGTWIVNDGEGRKEEGFGDDKEKLY